MVSKDKAYLVAISPSMKERAEDFTNKSCRTTYEYDGFLHGNTKWNRIYHGKLAEEAVAYYFNQNGFECDVDYDIYPNPSIGDDKDIVINGIRIDVKSGEKVFYKQMLVVKPQFDRIKKSDYYVGVNFDEDIAFINGYATCNEVANAEVGRAHKEWPVDNYTIPYERLHPIEDLLIKIGKHTYI